MFSCLFTGFHGLRNTSAGCSYQVKDIYMVPPTLPFALSYNDYRKLNLSAYICYIYTKCRWSDPVPDAKHGVRNWSSFDIQAIFLPAKCDESFVTLCIWSLLVVSYIGCTVRLQSWVLNCKSSCIVMVHTFRLMFS